MSKAGDCEVPVIQPHLAQGTWPLFHTWVFADQVLLRFTLKIDLTIVYAIRIWIQRLFRRETTERGADPGFRGFVPEYAIRILDASALRPSPIDCDCRCGRTRPRSSALSVRRSCQI